MGKAIIITLPVPPAALKPNSRPHYMAKANATKRAKAVAATVGSQHRPPEPIKVPYVKLKWIVGDRRRRDGDNLMGWCKAYTDGLTLAGIWIDDKDVEWCGIKIEYEPGAEQRIVYVIARSVEDLEGL